MTKQRSKQQRSKQQRTCGRRSRSGTKRNREPMFRGTEIPQGHVEFKVVSPGDILRHREMGTVTVINAWGTGVDSKLNHQVLIMVHNAAGSPLQGQSIQELDDEAPTALYRTLNKN